MALQIFLSILISTWVFLVFFTIGGKIRKYANFNTDTYIEKLLLDTSLGFGFSGFSIMLLNFIKLVSPATIIIFLIVLSVLCFSQWYISLHNLITQSYNRTFPSIRFLFLLPTALFLLYFLRTLLPPSGFDALMYHLSCARLYLDHGGFYNIFFNPQSDFPMLTEMNFMIGLAFNNDLVCRQIGFLTEMISCGALLLFCRDVRLSWKEISIAITIFLTLTVTIASVSSCDVDFALASWIALSVYSLLKIVDKPSLKQLFIPAVFAGMAMSTKIFGIFVFPVLLMILIYKKKFNFQKLFFFCIIPAIMVLPWYLKSFFHKGTLLSINPSLIHSQGLGLPMGIEIQSQIAHFSINVLLRTLSAPWTFSLMPSQHQQDSLGPFFLAFLPFVLLIKLPSFPKLLLNLSGVYLGCILILEMLFIPGGASIRYLIVFPVFCIPVCMVVLKEMKSNHQLVYRFLAVLVSIQILCGSILLLKRYHKDWIALLTMKSKDDYYTSILPEFPAIKYINSLPDTATVMTLFNYDNYLIRKPFISAYRHYTSQQDFQNDLKTYSISYIFANNVLDTSANCNTFSDFDISTMVFSANGFYVYKVSTE